MLFRSDKKDPLLIAAEHLLSIVFYSPIYLKKMIADIEPEMIIEDLQSLYNKVIIYYTKHQNLDNFIDYQELDQQEKSTWIRLSLLGEKNYSIFSDKELENDFQDIVFSIKNRFLSQQRQVLINELRQAEFKADDKQQEEIIHKINLLNKEAHKLQR